MHLFLIRSIKRIFNTLLYLTTTTIKSTPYTCPNELSTITSSIDFLHSLWVHLWTPSRRESLSGSQTVIRTVMMKVFLSLIIKWKRCKGCHTYFFIVVQENKQICVFYRCHQPPCLSRPWFRTKWISIRSFLENQLTFFVFYTSITFVFFFFSRRFSYFISRSKNRPKIY